MLTTTPKKPVDKNQSIVLKYYFKYEYLAKYYAKKIFESHKIAYEFEDLEQEFKIKIYTSIIAYSAKWKEYNETKRYKPIPLEFYIKCALVNRSKDFIREINNAGHQSISIQTNEFDCGVVKSMEVDSQISVTPEKLTCVVNGIDLLQGLNKMEARCFLLYAEGFSLNKLRRMFKNKFEAGSVIHKQIEKLKAYKEKLYENNISEFVTLNMLNSDN